MRLGILTAGGDAPGLNPAIRALVGNAMQTYGWPPVVGIPQGFKGLVEALETFELTPANTRDLISRGGTVLHTTNRANPFQYPVGEDRYEDRSDQALERVTELGLDALAVLGGDGNLTIAHELAQKGLTVVGLPKTIDNDIQGTEICIGHMTAVTTASEALDRLHTTAESHHRVIVVETMGRYAGWIALRAGLAGAANSILLPEIPFDMDLLCQKIARLAHDSSPFSLIAVGEGAQPAGGTQAIQEPGSGVYQPQLGGIGDVVAEQLQKGAGLESRVTRLGHIQRGGAPVPLDRLLAIQCGTAAVDALARGASDCLITLQQDRIETIPLEQVVGGFRPVPLDHPLVDSARKTGIILGD